MKSTNQDKQHLIKWNKNFEIPLPLFLLTSSVESVSSMVQNVCKLLGPMLHSDARQQCTGFKVLQD